MPKRPWAVAGVLLGAVVVWGVSMGVIRWSFRKTAALFIQGREERSQSEPYVRRAKALGLRCEDARSRADAERAAVLWKVEESGPGGHCAGRPDLGFVWINPKDAERRIDRARRPAFTVLALIVETPRPGRPLALRYLGERDDE